MRWSVAEALQDLQCHEEEKTKNNCGFCHTDVKNAAPYAKRRRPIQLSHAAHIELVDEDCSRCHDALPEIGAPRHLTPPMKNCMSCHQHQEEYEQARCNRCHGESSSYSGIQVWVNDGTLQSYTEDNHYIYGDEKDSVLRWGVIGVPETGMP